MKILSLDSATEKSFLLLSENGKPIAYLPLIGGAALSKSLALEIKKMIDIHQFTPDAIAVGIGPGSFTGIRSAVAIAKALSFGWRIPVAGLCSLALFTPPEAIRCLILFDARSAGAYGLNTAIDAPAPRLLSVKDLEEIPPSIPFASPHPDRIRQKIKTPHLWIETQPNIEWTARQADRLLKMPPRPLVIDYGVDQNGLIR